MATLRAVAPGLAVLAVLAVLARAVGQVTPANALVVAIVAGVALAVTVGVPEWAQPGVDRYKLLLETGIVLLGAQMTLGQLVETGPLIVLLAVAVVAFGVVFVERVGRYAGVDSGTRSLLAAGASVCGVSAVVAVAGSVDAEEASISYAAGTVLLFDAVTLLVFPVVGTALGLSDRVFGVWAGLSLFSTGPTAAAGFAVSETAGRWATLTKLVRNTFIGVLAVGYALYARRNRGRGTGVEDSTAGAAGAGDDARSGTVPTSVRRLWTQFPKFLVGFLLVAAVANLGVVSEATLSTVDRAGAWLFTLAFVGLGFDMNPRRLRSTGVRPIAVVLAQFTTVSALSLLVVSVLFG